MVFDYLEEGEPQQKGGSIIRRACTKNVELSSMVCDLKKIGYGSKYLIVHTFLHCLINE
jgi:hypothetical protein